MRNVIYFLLICLCIGCYEKHKYLKRDSPDYIRLIKKINGIQLDNTVGVNSLQKDVIYKKNQNHRELYLDTIQSFLRDSMNYIIRDVKVKLKSIELVYNDTSQFIQGAFEDHELNEYWFSIKANPTIDSTKGEVDFFAFVKKMPEGVDTSLSFFFLGDISWKYTSGVSIHCIPFPNKYNFDKKTDTLP